jgi:hypothetical protein
MYNRDVCTLYPAFVVVTTLRGEEGCISIFHARGKHWMYQVAKLVDIKGEKMEILINDKNTIYCAKQQYDKLYKVMLQ